MEGDQGHKGKLPADIRGLISEYIYRPISQPNGIRLLRLLPSKDELGDIRCELFESALRSSDKHLRPFEAVSYCWGSNDKTKSIRVTDQDHDQELKVTENLHAALVRLRDEDIVRILWVDAICIDQSNKEEKGHQIKQMAELYAKAGRVIVWLGESENGSDKALMAIHEAARNLQYASSPLLASDQSISALFERPWFRRIWVLQEVAAARQILIICGSTELDGHAFCLGLSCVEHSLEQIAFLMRGAIFRPRYVSRDEKSQFSVKIGSLAELLDMYNGHEATEPLDKVYALLGMCSDTDLSPAGLEPDYNLQFSTIMNRLVRYLFKDKAHIEAWSERHTPLIKAKGRVFGQVSDVQWRKDSVLGNRQTVTIVFRKIERSGLERKVCNHWILRRLAKPVQAGDIICLLEGSSMPTIIRSCEDYFDVICVAVAVQSQDHQDDDVDDTWTEIAKSTPFAHKFHLAWKWDNRSKETQEPFKPITWIRTDGERDHPELSSAIRKWNIAQILGHLGRFEERATKKDQAAQIYESVAGVEHLHSLSCSCDLVPLLWALEMGDVVLVKQKLTKGADPSFKDYNGLTMFELAAKHGHEAVVDLLLEPTKYGLAKFKTTKGWDGQAALMWAARNGHITVVRLLLETNHVEIRRTDGYVDSAVLWLAADNGHHAIVKLLLDCSMIYIEAFNVLDRWNGEHALMWAANNGHTMATKVLLEMNWLDIGEKHSYLHQKALRRAAENGHEAVVKMLLEAGVEFDAKDELKGCTALICAAQNGHGATIQLLLDAGAAVNTTDNDGRTALMWAAWNRHEAVVKQLLEADANIDEGDSTVWKALTSSVQRRHGPKLLF